MNPEHYVSLGLAKQLKEVGMRQEGFSAYWYPCCDEYRIAHKGDGGNLDGHYAAPNASELLEMLPGGIALYSFTDMVGEKQYVCENLCGYGKKHINKIVGVKEKYGYTACEALGLMYLELLKKGDV